MTVPVTPTSDDHRTPPRRLTRSSSDEVIGGVCGGLGHYFAIDPIWFRIAFVVLALGGGSSVLLYVVLWVVVPDAQDDGEQPPPPSRRTPPASGIVGLIFMAVGVMLMLNAIEPDIGRYFWPLALLVAGGALVIGGWSDDRN